MLQYSLTELQGLAQRALEGAGASAAMAASTAKALIAAEAQGLASHGLSRLPQYAGFLRNGLMLLFDIQGRGQILTCPRCRKVFVADRARTQFCSNLCQNAAKVQRFRAREAQREQASDNKKHDQDPKHRKD